MEKRMSSKCKKKKKTHILSLLLQKLDLLFIHLYITWFSWGFLCSFSTLGAHKTFLSPQHYSITQTPHRERLYVGKFQVTNELRKPFYVFSEKKLKVENAFNK